MGACLRGFIERYRRVSLPFLENLASYERIATQGKESEEDRWHLMVGQLVTSWCYNQSRVHEGKGVGRSSLRVRWYLMVGQLVTSRCYNQSWVTAFYWNDKKTTVTSW